ncbi:hypothetical protein [Rhizobium leguminosarum]|uniref:COG3904 family protein n=1 Tax=Rhizobium leguminosarum TaxID=384 RepID=UPI001FDA5AB9|nr:hypothetical protein [Rhizobium leguminosarum]
MMILFAGRSTAAWVVGFLVALGLFAAESARAAEVTKSATDICVLRLEGEIVDGDLARLKNLASANFKGFDGESSSHDTLCLNSPGGSVVEGVKLADFIYKTGIGTVIDKGDECYSICSVMFMMGIAQGPEVNFVNRKLNVAGKLGFHRPYLAIDSDEMINVKALAIAHDAAIESITQLMVLANNQVPWSNSTMMKPDLIQAMLSHIGNGLYYIDTVDKAGRFEIELFGGGESTGLTEAQAYYACENGFHWQVGLIGKDTDYQRLRLQLGTNGAGDGIVKLVSDGPLGRLFAVTSEDEGYSEARCLIGLKNGYVQGCGYNGMYNVSVGQGQCTPENFEERAQSIPRVSLLKPGLSLGQLEGAAVNADDGAAPATCAIFSASGETEQEKCSVRFANSTGADGQKASKWEFTWPTGNKTIVQRQGKQLRINGKEASMNFAEGYAMCAVNAESGNRFCFKF